MNRLQKKCLVFSFGLHGLLALILLASAGFGEQPPETDMQVLSMIPANILDRAEAGGGQAVAVVAPQPLAAQPAPRPQPVPPPPQPQPVHTHAVERVVRPTPHPIQEEERPVVTSREGINTSAQRLSSPRQRKEVIPTFTPASQTSNAKSSEAAAAAEAAARAKARAETRRLKEIENALSELASGVQNSGAPKTVVDVGIGGGGETFASYRQVIFSVYYHAWATPDNVADRLASADARIVVARDGSIISGEVIRRSGTGAVDRSVERALRAVTKLPPFPAGSNDEERTFVIRFNLEAKQGTG